MPSHSLTNMESMHKAHYANSLSNKHGVSAQRTLCQLTLSSTWSLCTNDNFWQAISVFMFQGECTVNFNNLFSKPSTPILTWTNPRQSFLGNYDYASNFTYDNSSVSVRFHFLDLHLPSSASVWSVYLGLVPCKLDLFGCECF